ncbi:chemotaxis protein PomA [mine drainage metagenome]|uniref:Chemotaxis protein PomA n=1 Tax=mine drainage metagenome TaxID=410659 RepID=A0A1J5SMK5_9ZZZZ
MDRSSVGGVVLALIGILLGQAIEGGHAGSLLQPAAFMIVICGTFGAVLLQTSTTNFITGLLMVRQVFVTPANDKEALVRRINIWSTLSRKDGILMLEPYFTRETDLFVKKGLRLLIDGTPPAKLQEICSNEMYYYEMQQRNAAKIWEAAGGYSPTVGILGAVLGLIHVMENLSDPSKLGGGIAVAFVATIYGVGLANLLFLPIANKLKSLIQQEAVRREVLINAWVSIANGDHPRIVEERLLTYLEK